MEVGNLVETLELGQFWSPPQEQIVGLLFASTLAENLQTMLLSTLL
jgi:hypothetical protein